MVVRDTTGSSTASMSSCRFSIKSGLPFSRQLTTMSMYLCCESWIIFMSFADSLLRIHLMPWSCGSIMSAHRAALLMMAPFSIESGSVGSPSLPHCARSESSEMTSSGMTPSVIGISRSLRSGIQRSSVSELRNLELKGPAYDTKEEARSTSPTSLPSAMPNFSIVALQRLFSPERPFTSRSAKSAFFCVLSAAAMAAFLSSVAFIKLASRAVTRSWSSFTLARMPDSFLFALSSFLFASESRARFGATTW
mmetsp:Transcript_24003/g.78109  ORF Transcript_24003/g.78109 Transcript_24003/m.78109 type:complete len:251 (+) Transcript_24003:483-1235(+)